MTLHARVSRVDDYTGALGQALEKLEIEKSRGTLNKDEQIDFINDLKKAVYAKDIKPWRSRTTFFFVAVIALAAASRFVPGALAHREAVELGVLALAGLSLASFIFSLVMFIQRQRRDKRWLEAMEQTVAKGGTILDHS